MSDVLAAFPRRPLRLTPPRLGLRAWALALFCTLLFGGGLFLMVKEVVPGLQQDLAIRDSAEPIAGGRVVNGRCTTRMAVYTSCDVTLAYAPKGAELHRQDMHYVFVDAHFGDYEAAVMADPAEPEKLTTDLGLERMTNRLVTAAGVVLIGLALIIGSIWGAMRTGGAYGAVARGLSGRPLEPVLVDIQPGKGQSWLLHHDGKTIQWPVPKKAVPFLVGEGRALAVTTPGGPIFPLDEKLRWIDLTEPERQALAAAR